MTRPTRTRARSLIAALLLVGLGLAATSASAHFKTDDGRHFISGHTVDGPDPITLVFKGHTAIPESNWYMGFWNGDRGTMTDQGCGGDTPIYYLHPRTRDDEEDDEWHTDGCTEDKNHIRIFDSVEHDQAYGHTGIQARQWAVGAVHHDDFHWEERCSGNPLGTITCVSIPVDSIDVGWEVMETRARRQLRELCAWGNTIRLIGSFGPFQDYHSNGTATRISMRQDLNGCPG
jgi:hypothetical protein